MLVPRCLSAHYCHLQLTCNGTAILARVLGVVFILSLAGCGATGTAKFDKKPTALVWISRASLPGPRANEASAVGPDGRIYVFGGTDGFTDAVHPSSFVYDPTTDSWTAIADVPTARTQLGAATGQNGLIYTMGGAPANSNFEDNVVEAYNPLTNTWTCSVGDTTPGCSSSTLAPMPTSRTTIVLAGHNGLIYAFGPVYPQEMEAYDPTTNTWTCSVGYDMPGCASSTLAPAPTGPNGYPNEGAVGADGKLYMFGLYPSYNTFEVYDPVGNQWTCSTNDTSTSGCASKTLRPMPSGIYLFAAAGTPNGHVYVLGGVLCNSALTASNKCIGVSRVKVNEYNPQTNAWSSYPSMLTDRSSLAAVGTADGYVYAIGGVSSNSAGVGTPLDSVERCCS